MKYITEDGKEFHSLKEAKAHERRVLQVIKALNKELGVDTDPTRLFDAAPRIVALLQELLQDGESNSDASATKKESTKSVEKSDNAAEAPASGDSPSCSPNVTRSLNTAKIKEVGKGKRRRFTLQEKVTIVKQAEDRVNQGTATYADVAKEHDISSPLLSTWRKDEKVKSALNETATEEKPKPTEEQQTTAPDIPKLNISEKTAVPRKEEKPNISTGHVDLPPLPSSL